jgi:putative membrane protein
MWLMNKVRFARAALATAGIVLVTACGSPMAPDMRMGAAPTVRLVTVAQAPFTPVERDFVVRVAAKTVYEIEVSRLAADKAAAPGVAGFARTMVTHHTQMNDELVALMSAHGVPPPRELAAAKATKLHRLAAVPRGDAFDNGYIRVVGIEDHRAAIASFEKARSQARDPDLRVFIDRWLTVLRSHLAAAQDVAAGLAG